MRAAHQILDANPKILVDPVAVGLVEGSTEEEIRARAEMHHQIPLEPLRAVMVLRSRFAEDRLQEAAAAGVEQYVLLGAGLDTFAFRQPAWARDLRIIEVDHPASQEFKRERIAERGITVPTNVEFCPLDFEHTTLAEGLAATTFDFGRPTFLSWLGVTQYLTESAIEATLRFVLTLPPPSQIVFEFVPAESSVESDDVLYWLKRLTELAASIGEPWITRFDPKYLREWLLELGFTSAFCLSPEITFQRYFAGRTDGLEAPWLELLMCASV